MKQWWYFTFGLGQEHAGHYVKFFGAYEDARQQMVDHYGLKWAFQYSEEDWQAWEQRCKNEHMEWMLETELKR